MKRQIIKKVLLVALLISTIYCTDNQLQAQSDTALFEKHYVLPEFTLGTVKMKDGHQEAAMMNYNKLTEEMIFEKDGIMLALDSLSSIDTVYIDEHIFIPHEKSFYEVLVIGRVSLYLEHKCNLLAAGNDAGYGQTTETGASRNITSLTNSGRAYKLKLPSDYHVTDASKFWIRLGDAYYKANNSSQVIKVFPDRSKDIKAFIKQKKLDLTKGPDMVVLVVKCNEFVH